MKYNKSEKNGLPGKFSLRKRKRFETPDILCEGISTDNRVFEKKENRIWSLFMKGILVYLVCAGTIGSVLEAAGTPYYAVFVHLVLLIASVGFSCMYYRKLTANIGALLFLVVTVFFAFQLNRYINSGFYAVLNDLNDHASTYFNLEGVRVYTEQVNNRRVAATISMSFLGIVGSMILTIFLMYWMRYLSAASLSLLFFLFPIYIRREPGVLYPGMVLMGIFAAYAWRRAGHYSKVDSNSAYKIDKKGNFCFSCHRKALFSFLGQILICVLVLMIAAMSVNPREVHMAKQKTSAMKLRTEDIVENFVRLGVFGFVNRYESVGGMSSGRLGGVSSVNLSYEPLLKLRITPYTYDTVYLRGYSYREYVPYENRWMDRTDIYSNRYEVVQLWNAFQKSEKGSAEGKVEVEQVANAAVGYLPHPYYTLEGNTIDNKKNTLKFIYYPRLDANKTPIEQEPDREYWLQIPEENYETIAKFCEEAGFGADDDGNSMGGIITQEEIITQVKDYFQQEIPYTLRPGATPRKQDFINYFLEKSRKGYCSYFASAATLIFRYYGIPAKYVEGFAVSYDQMLDGTLVEGAEYADYYKGYSELGETALVEVELTDADAHAWVEVYDERYGWMPVEVTPYSTTEEIQGMDFWSMFLSFINTDEAEADMIAEEDNREPTLWNLSINRPAVGRILILSAVAVAIFFCTRWLVWWIRYYRASRNDRLILCYKRFLSQRARRYKLLSEKMNYREQIAYLTEDGTLTEAEKKEIITVLEKAGFSNHSITPDEDQLVRKKLFSN